MASELPETDLLQTTTVWQRHSTGELLACQPGASAACVSDDILASYHPLLARALHATLDWKERTAARNRSVGKTTVLTILGLLNGEGFAFIDYYGNDQLLREVDKVAPHHHGWVVLHGFSVNKHVIEDAAGSLPVVTDVTWASHTVTQEELEKRSPGWDARLKIGLALNLPDEDLAKYVLDTYPGEEVQNIMTAGLTFD